MKSYDAGHKETQTVLPEPLASMGVWNVGNFALPSTMLSVASAAVFAIVFGFLQLGSGHELFVLPSPDTFLIAAAATLLAGLIVFQCRRRPGRIGPRIWALALLCLNGVAAILGYVFHDQSWALALAVAGLAAAITLAPRLIKLRPDSAMVQYIAPLSLLMILLIILPSSCAVRRVIAKGTESRVGGRIRQLRLWTTELNEITSFNWRRIEDNPDAASLAVEKLKKLNFKSDRDEAEIWRSAAMLGKDGELSQATQDLTDQVVAGFTPARIPRVSDLKEAAVHWDAQEKRWEAYSQFSKLSEIAGSYHQELGRLFSELRDVPANEARLVEYRQHYAAQRQLLQSDLADTANSWGDNWMAFRVPGHAELMGRENEPLADLLRAPFASSENGVLKAGDLVRLASLPLYETRRCAQGSPGCSGAKMPPGQQNSRGAPGCHCQNFREKSMEYFRLDCYSYAPRSEGTGAALRVEMRLVYQSEAGGFLRDQSVPSEVFFYFMIPDGRKNGEFRGEVMTALAAATRELKEDATVRSFDRSGSVAGGFVIDTGQAPFRVEQKLVTLKGLNPEPEALQVQVFPTRNARFPARRELR
jgi:hypothetical protein